MDPKTLLEVGDVVTIMTFDEAAAKYGVEQIEDDIDGEVVQYIKFPEDDGYYLELTREDLMDFGGHSAVVTEIMHFSGEYHYHYSMDIDNGDHQFVMCPSMFSAVGCACDEEIPDIDADSIWEFILGEETGV